MRTLKFIVNRQNVKPDPDCDFSGLVPGTEGYLKAEFSFSQEWTGCKKVVAFWKKTTITSHECPPQILEDGRTCIIPAEALTGTNFEIQIIGKKDGLKLVTNKLIVMQDGGVG